MGCFRDYIECPPSLVDECIPPPPSLAQVLLHNPEFLLSSAAHPPGTERGILLDERRRYIDQLREAFVALEGFVQVRKFHVAHGDTGLADRTSRQG